MADTYPTPLPGTDPKLFARFMAKVQVTDGCWLWTAGRFRQGYGIFVVSGGPRGAHRVAWEFFRGAITSDPNASRGATLYVLHNCPGGDDRACVNPDHLWLGTNIQNQADKVAKGRSARGDRHGSRTHPERVPRGDRNGSRLHPERCARGASHWSTSLNDIAVRVIRFLAARGVSPKRLAASHGISRRSVYDIVNHKVWRHI